MFRAVALYLLAWPVAAFSIADSVHLRQAKLDAGGEGDDAYYWAGKNGNLLRTGASQFSASVKLQDGPAWSWHEKGNGLIRAAPLIDNNKNIYLASIRGNVYKFSKDGKVLWTHSEAHSIPDVPAIMGGALYATNTDGQVFALDMQTGQMLWKTKVLKCSAGDTWSMTAGDGVVVAAVSDSATCSTNNHLVALDAKTGSVMWSFKPIAPVYNALTAVHEGSLVFSDLQGRAYRLSLTDGHVIWKSSPGLEASQSLSFTTGGTVIGSNGVLYVTSNVLENKTGGTKENQGYVTAFSFANGTLLWRHCTEYEANNAASVGRLGRDGPMAVVVGVGKNPDLPNPVKQLFRQASSNEKKARIVALNAQTGKELWKKELPAWHGWAAGDTIAHICLPDAFGNPALSADGTAYIGFASGRFYGVNDWNHDGHIDESELTSWDTGNAFQGSPGLAPGMVVATPCNGMHVFHAA
mmetsp:Transcript_115330/g.337165  ORF Transcript_115330/g.337165 Transcript_115330/m.337165 type:complete len:466 (-) Transcript_115330:49-1446(-)